GGGAVAGVALVVAGLDEGHALHERGRDLRALDVDDVGARAGDGGGADRGEFLVLLGAGGAAHADRADDLAVHHDRDAALQRREVVERGHRGPPLVDDVLEERGRLLEQRGGARLAGRDARAGGEGAVDALERHQVAAVVDDRDRGADALGVGLGDDGRDRAPRALEGQRLLVDNRGYASLR